MSGFYTGVGSRATPPDVLLRMRNIAETMRKAEVTLRSGGAEGADEAFESGAGTLKEVYLPWPSFRNRTSHSSAPPKWIVPQPSPGAYEIAASVIPWWTNLSPSHRKLHARNAHQVLGRDLATPSQKLICWTPKGESVGGTRTAIEIARKWGVEVVNLFDE